MVDICAEETPKIGKHNKMYSLNEILADVCNAMEQPIKKVVSKDRHREIVTCRQIYGYIARLHTKHSLWDISVVVGYDDHTTIISNNKKIRNFIKQKDPIFMESWDKYTEKSEIWKYIC
jgi:chromosomal replication initiation ATPase DnaA